MSTTLKEASKINLEAEAENPNSTTYVVHLPQGEAARLPHDSVWKHSSMTSKAHIGTLPFKV
jgi:hypothetical protein